MIERSGAKCNRKLSSASFLKPRSALVRTGEIQARGVLGQTILGVELPHRGLATLFVVKPGASQRSPLRVAPGVPQGLGGDPEPVQMILRSTITSVWGALPHAATADSCDTVKKVTFEKVFQP